MRSNDNISPNLKALYLTNFLFLFLCMFFELHAQFQIVGMQYNGAFANSVNLTILNPDGTQFTGSVPFDAYKQYPSGTTFKTPANTAISILYKGQTQIISPNSSLKVSIVNNGVIAQTLTGKVQHVLKDVKQKLGFYKAGNGYTWAHAEGTDFFVEAYDKSKKAKFITLEGTIAILEEVPVSITQTATNLETHNGKTKERELTTTKRIYASAGQDYVTEELEPITYATYEEALYAFDDEINQLEAQGNAYPEELADLFTLLGELYLDNGQFDEAIVPLAKSVEYNNQVDPEAIETLEAVLYFCEALINATSDEAHVQGVNLVQEIIGIFTEELKVYLSEYKYAYDIQDYDLAWELCNDLVDLNEYLGWSHDLLENYDQAEYYYKWSDYYNGRL